MAVLANLSFFITARHVHLIGEEANETSSMRSVRLPAVSGSDRPVARGRWSGAERGAAMGRGCRLWTVGTGRNHRDFCAAPRNARDQGVLEIRCFPRILRGVILLMLSLIAHVLGAAQQVIEAYFQLYDAIDSLALSRVSRRRCSARSTCCSSLSPGGLSQACIPMPGPCFVTGGVATTSALPPVWPAYSVRRHLCSLAGSLIVLSFLAVGLGW